MTYDLIEIEEDLTEPVTLPEAKSYLQVDQDYAGDDGDINLAISTARIRLEQYLNVGLINRDVEVQWDGKVIDLPLYPNGAIASIKFNEETDPLESDLYTVSRGNNKKLGINSKMCYGGGGSWWYSRINMTAEFTPNNFGHDEIDTDIYSCIYNTGFENLPLALKQALLAEVSYIFKLRGEPITDLISPNASKLANGYSHNLVLNK